MGSTMKKSIFDEQTNKALMSWHKHAQKKKAEGKPSPAPPARKLVTPPDSPHDSPQHPNSHRVGHASSVDIPEQRSPFNKQSGGGL